ncbi:Fur family transcriptional regulator, ferric uptake regulator [Mucilaginibacter lappiensis]|uniref:Fur family ferric uptake transcriptional regulator n=1 Tax=Mucilaginibacter lappiensis TaxID=354630 RepID=A0ABR6PH25_9SPHI|nr:transcriptional repressor [Mucilaginibacter lappiensis]MBB6109060.1 Fur family ferric uptake transcriptional regulator [Mucilaginibacter lappiensis]SIQ73996.1 Fur family transcriptional regulator, ferric uptake regulator [Mucilaginibacter lappiensis]
MAQTRNNFHFEDLLNKHHLKKTAPRLRVLSMMSSRSAATSQPDLESVMSDIDRVTLYRILNAFEEKGIIHKVFDLNGTANYALCTSNCDEGHHHDDHLHFNCTNCKNVYCLDELHLPTITLPPGFEPTGFTLYATGLCPKCSKKAVKK